MGVKRRTRGGARGDRKEYARPGRNGLRLTMPRESGVSKKTVVSGCGSVGSSASGGARSSRSSAWKAKFYTHLGGSHRTRRTGASPPFSSIRTNDAGM